jgi:hypothetical protein
LKTFCIASPHKNQLWYDYRLYLNLKHELCALGYTYRPGAVNRIYFLGGPQRQFYPEVGEFDNKANNIALIYCHAEKLQSISQFNKVYVCSEGIKQFLAMQNLPHLNAPFISASAIDVIPPFSSLSPAQSTMPRYSCDISFMGVPRVRPALDALLPLLDELNLKLNLYGPGWDNYANNINLEKYWVARQIPYEDIPKLARGSKICLIDHHASMNEIGAVSHKYIDFVMSGAFVVSDYNIDAIQTYKGICFSEKNPLKTIIQTYLQDEQKRKAHVKMQQGLIERQTTKDAAITISANFL